jgi:hypothetical protein
VFGRGCELANSWQSSRATLRAVKGTEKGAKVTVYYTESAGKKVAHFFEKL